MILPDQILRPLMTSFIPLKSSFHNCKLYGDVSSILTSISSCMVIKQSGKLHETITFYYATVWYFCRLTGKIYCTSENICSCYNLLTSERKIKMEGNNCFTLHYSKLLSWVKLKCMQKKIKIKIKQIFSYLQYLKLASDWLI